MGMGSRRPSRHRLITFGLRAFVAVTDPSWLQCLQAVEAREANFWQPRPTLIQQDIGTPWLFKVKGLNAIAGYGIFSYYTQMPASVAWETFGPSNGAASYQKMISAISRLRRSTASDDTIGCVVLSDLLILKADSYVAAPIGSLISFSVSTMIYATDRGRKHGFKSMPIQGFLANSVRRASSQTDLEPQA